MFPNDPQVRGSYYKSYKVYAKLRKYKKRELRQSILEKLDQLQTNNPKEYWTLLNSLREKSNDRPEKGIDDNEWYNYFSLLPKVPESYNHRIEQIKKEVNQFESSFTDFKKLDFQIKITEIHKAISSMKNNKSTGIDGLCNEMFRSAQSYIDKCLLKIYNAVLSSGHYPSRWSESFLVPIFKSDNPKLPQNYRGIAVANCFGRIFNSIFNTRLDKFLAENNVIHESQIDFSKKSRTSDHLFVLKCLVDKYINSGDKKLFVCFVDFRKAFDTVIHPGIRLKLLVLRNNINGYFYRILCNMYGNNYMSVKLGNKLTDSFKSQLRVKQGDVLTFCRTKGFWHRLEVLPT